MTNKQNQPMENKKNLKKLFYQGLIVALAIASMFIFQYQNFAQKDLKTDIFDVNSPMVMADPPDNSTLPGNFSTFAVKLKNYVNLSTLNAVNFKLTDKNGQYVESSIWFEHMSKTIYLQPWNILPTPESTNAFNLNLSADLKDIYGNSIGPATIRYVVKNAPDNTPPVVLWTSPGNGDSSVNPNSRGYILVGFNKAMNPDLDRTGTWTSTATLPPYPLTSYEPDIHAMRIDFFDPLPPNTVIPITLQSNLIKDASGNAMQQNYTFTFTTGPYDAPANLTAGIDFKKSGFEVFFNKPIQKETAINPTMYTLVCDANQINISNASFDYLIKEKKLLVGNLNLAENSRCAVTFSADFWSLDGYGFDPDARTVTGNQTRIATAGKDYYNRRATEASWFRWKSCTSCKGIIDNDAKFFYPTEAVPMSKMAGDITSYTFSLMLSKAHRNGDIIKLTLPGFDVHSATIPSVPINKNITTGNTKVVTFSNIKNNPDTGTIELTLNIANGVTIGENGAYLKFMIANIGNPLIASDSYAGQWKSASSQGGFTIEGPHLFSPITVQKKGNGQITVRVLNEDTGAGINGIPLVFKGAAIGAKKFVTDSTGAVIFTNIAVPEDITKSNYVRVYLDEGQIPANFSPQSAKSLSFNLNASTPAATGNLLLKAASTLQIRGTITHPGSLGGTQVHVWTGGSASIKKTLTLSGSGATNFTIYPPKEGDYQVGISNFVDFNGEGRERTNMITPVPISLFVTSATSPVNVNFSLLQATQSITGILQNNEGKPIPNGRISITSEHENNNVWLSDTTITNTDGTYSIGAIPGNFVMEAYRQGFSYRTKKAVTVKTNDTIITMDFVLKEPTIAVGGMVKDMNGLGIKDANVSCINAKGDTSDAQTDQQGQYNLYVDSGESSCRALTAAKGYVDAIKKRSITGPVTNFDFSEDGAVQFSAIVGKLLITENQPANNVLVTAIKYNSQKIIGQEYSTRTELDGKFNLRVATNNPGETYKVIYINESGISEAANKVTVGPNITDLGAIVYPRQNIVTFSAANIPASVNELTLNLYSANTQSVNFGVIGVFNGRASEKVKLPNGNYRLEAIIQGLGKKILEFSLTGGDTSINIDFADTVLTTLTVQVNDSIAKTPLEDVFVEAVGNNNGLFASAKTNTNGQATLQIAPGTYTIRASKKDFLPVNSPTKADKTQYTLELTAAAASITGTVKDTNNNAVVNAVVNAAAVDKSATVNETTDQSGNFNLKVAPNTIWNIMATTTDGKFTNQNNINAGTANLVLTANQTVSGFTPETPAINNIDATQDNYITTKFANLEIDNNSLGSNANGTNIVLKKVAAVPKTDTATPVGFGIEINATDTMGSNITKSNNPFGIQINFDKDTIGAMSSVSGFNKKTLKGSVGYYDDIKKTWILLPTTQIVKVQMAPGSNYTRVSIDDYIASPSEQYAGANDIFIENTANTNHLSVFALVNKEEINTSAPTTPTPPTQTQQSVGGTAPGQSSSSGGSSGGGSSGGSLNSPTGGTGDNNAPLRGAASPQEKKGLKAKKTLTFMINKISVKQYDPIRIFGMGSATSQIIANISGREKITLRINTASDGSYSYNLDTTLLPLGRYGIQIQDGDLQSKKIYFIVGTENILSEDVAAIVGDLNKDGFVNLIDFSIMAYWYGQNQPTNAEEKAYYNGADLNKDGVVDLQDFRILIVNWTG